MREPERKNRRVGAVERHAEEEEEEEEEEERVNASESTARGGAAVRPWSADERKREEALGTDRDRGNRVARGTARAVAATGGIARKRTTTSPFDATTDGPLRSSLDEGHGVGIVMTSA